MQTSALTREQILAMRPGREMDAAIAVFVFGENVELRERIPDFSDVENGILTITEYRDYVVPHSGGAIAWTPVAPYSTDDTAAALVATHLAHTRDVRTEIEIDSMAYGEVGYRANVDCGAPVRFSSEIETTLALAICRASLLASTSTSFPPRRDSELVTDDTDTNFT